MTSSRNTGANSRRGTTAQRPSAPQDGDIYYDTTLKQLVNYSTVATTWVAAGTVGTAPLIDYLVVAGGGGANTSAEQSGGGGGGGLRSTVTATGGNGTLETALSLITGNAYTVTVGAGGAIGASGGNSVFSTITSIGGGYGAARIGVPSTSVGGNGGSSGGGSDFGGVPGTRTASPVQGYNGGTGQGDSGGGGGGAGGVGGDSTGANSGNGGAALAVSITGSSVSYAGGGKGGDAPSGSASPANSGKGGDAGPHPTSQTGGSGIVIIKIPNNFTATFSGGVTSSLNTSVTGFKIYTVTATSTTSETVTFA